MTALTGIQTCGTEHRAIRKIFNDIISRKTKHEAEKIEAYWINSWVRVPVQWFNQDWINRRHASTCFKQGSDWIGLSCYKHGMTLRCNKEKSPNLVQFIFPLLAGRSQVIIFLFFSWQQFVRLSRQQQEMGIREDKNHLSASWERKHPNSWQ